MKHKFDIIDSFKGNFTKSKKKDESSLIYKYFNAKSIQDIADPTAWWNTPINIKVSRLGHSPLIPIKFYMDDKKQESEDDFSYFNDIGEYIDPDLIITKELMELEKQKYNQTIENLCEHDPIDVGFNCIKMVCRKCDKNL